MKPDFNGHDPLSYLNVMTTAGTVLYYDASGMVIYHCYTFVNPTFIAFQVSL